MHRVIPMCDSCIARRNAFLLPGIWFMAGLSRALPGVAMRMLLVNELGVQPAKQAILGVWGSLPWNFKMLMAFLSDTVPICGRRRSPYLGAGLALQLFAFSTLASYRPTASTLGPLDFMQACGMVAVGTMSDTLIVESMKREHSGKDTFGNLQTNCWIAMFVGSLVGNAISGYAYEGLSTSGVFTVTALLKLAMLCLPAAVVDPAGHRVSCAVTGGLTAKYCEIIDGCDDPRVWKPMLFIFAFAACPHNGDAWNSFLYGRRELATTANATAAAGSGAAIQPLGLPEATLGWVGVVTTVSQVAGAAAYRFFLKRVPLRRLFGVIVVASSALQCTQLILITRTNTLLGLPDVAFALGDDAVIEVSRELLAMPM